MRPALLRPFLVLVGLCAGLKLLVGLSSGVFKAESGFAALIGVAVVPSVLVLAAIRLAPQPRRRRSALALGATILCASLLAAAFGLTELVLARAQGVPMETALAQAAPLRNATGLGLCIAALCWGLACAGNILAPRGPKKNAG